MPPRYPSLYQINTRVWLSELARGLGRTATLDDIPDDELDRLSELGFDWIWLLTIWQTGPEARQVSLVHPQWQQEFHETLPDLSQQDISGSGFAIIEYCVHTELGGDAALARLRQRLKQRGIKLMLDFVPNHMGLGHPWIDEHPDFFVQGTEHDLAREPHNYTSVKGKSGERVFAHGRDPYFPGWPDTLQINYANSDAQQAMINALFQIADRCDGVRCDMAMLVLPEVFERTWKQKSQAFWPEAMRRVRERVPGFTFMAEVYWDLEWTLLQQGFDYAYDKRLYDRLRDGNTQAVREHFKAGLDYQDKMARFLENHDESRAATAFAGGKHEATAVVAYLAPGLRFFHRGQFEGRQKRISPHLGRGPDELTNQSLHDFYLRLLAVLREPAVRNGHWQLLETRAAWEGNWTWDSFIAFAWQLGDSDRVLAVANCSDHQSQCYLTLPFHDLQHSSWRLEDLLSGELYNRNGEELESRGLYLDMRPWQAAIYVLSRMPP